MNALGEGTRRELPLPSAVRAVPPSALPPCPPKGRTPPAGRPQPGRGCCPHPGKGTPGAGAGAPSRGLRWMVVRRPALRNRREAPSRTTGDRLAAVDRVVGQLGIAHQGRYTRGTARASVRDPSLGSTRVMADSRVSCANWRPAGIPQCRAPLAHCQGSRAGQPRVSGSMIDYCTYFDINYIHRGLALYRSLERHAQDFRLWILCFDDRTYDVLGALRLRHAKLIRRQAFEAGDDALLEAQGNRSKVEYYWTCSPSLPLYVLRHAPGVEEICYLDADLYFFSDPQAISGALGAGSILITPHDYDEGVFGGDTPAGRYNVGAIAFRRDDQGIACLRWWRDRCLEWCHSRPEDGKLGDQVYLDDWPQRFGGVVVCQHVGINAGPWNIGKRTLALDGQRLMVDGSPLVCYHFHKVRILGRRLAWVLGARQRQAREVIGSIYRPYLRELFDIEAELQPFRARLPRQGFPWMKAVRCLGLPKYLVRA
jgi:hypothetical protein